MASFTDEQQTLHRDLFVEECRQKAWGAACHADWIAKQLDTLVADYTKLEVEQGRVDEEIKATDYKTPESRDKLKALQARRDALPARLTALKKNMQQVQQVLSGLYQNIEVNLQLATYAETWAWKEVSSQTP
jgi:chromosome segregation ATPase